MFLPVQLDAHWLAANQFRVPKPLRTYRPTDFVTWQRQGPLPEHGKLIHEPTPTLPLGFPSPHAIQQLSSQVQRTRVADQLPVTVENASHQVLSVKKRTGHRIEATTLILLCFWPTWLRQALAQDL